MYVSFQTKQNLWICIVHVLYLELYDLPFHEWENLDISLIITSELIEQTQCKFFMKINRQVVIKALIK